MNHEILFRGKSVETNEWVYGSYILEKYGNTPYICYFEYGTFVNIKQVEVIPETVGEFTGMTDKNGKKIFEGDILEFSDRIVSVFWHAHLGCWDSDFIKFTNKENDREDMSPCRWSYRAKVVGNIHDNPELLKDGKK